MMFTGVGFGPSGCCDGYRSRLSTILVYFVATGIKFELLGWM